MIWEGIYSKKNFICFPSFHPNHITYPLTNSHSENFFITLAKTAPTEVLFEYFDRLCPGIFFPSPLLFTSMVDHLICFNGVDYIERFFTELNKYSYYNLNNLNNRIFHLIVSVPRNEKTDARFADFLLKSLESYANAQLRMDHDKSIE